MFQKIQGSCVLKVNKMCTQTQLCVETENIKICPSDPMNLFKSNHCLHLRHIEL